MFRALSVLFSGMLTLFWALPASAASITYSNEAAFVSATGATLHPLSITGPSGALSLTTTDSLLTLVSASGNLITDWADPGNSGVSRLAGPDLAISGPESFDGNVALGADRYAFGFGIFESTDTSIAGCNTTCVDSTFTITLFNNGIQLVPSFSLSPPDNVAAFWGIHTDFAFDSVQIRETIGSNDNEVFGTFYTGTRSSAVPEPGTLLLLGTGGLGLLAKARRRRLMRAPKERR